MLPTLQAGALYEDQYPLISALSRPLIAEKLVRGRPRARRRRRRPRLHRQGQRPGALRGRGRRAGADLAVLAPGARLGHDPRAGDRLRRRSTASRCRSSSGAAYSIDHNLWGRSIEAGPLEDPWIGADRGRLALTMAPERGLPARKRSVAFEDGVPVSIDGEAIDLVSLIGRAGALAGAHGVGRIDMIENRLVGIKSPRDLRGAGRGAAVDGLRRRRGAGGRARPRPHQGRRSPCATRSWSTTASGSRRFARRSTHSWTRPPRRSPARPGVRLFRGSCAVVGRRAPRSLYDHGAGHLRAGRRLQHGAAAGFIHVWSLGTKTWAGGHRRAPPCAG